MSDKIGEQHVSRKAIVYVRQSSTRQLRGHHESRRLQYAMRQRVRDLGWREVEVIDDDLGKSASGKVERGGFERMVAEVSLGNVGAVASREISRFARNSRDWQQLLEICRVVHTVLVDHDTVYDPRNTNDRLLLGLKGTLSEYELDLLRVRATEAKWAKVRRGELISQAPVGYRKTEAGKLEKHPDRRVQQAIALLFSKFLELGSVRQVLVWFREHELQFPRATKESIQWRPCAYSQLISILKNPTYAGAYVYGRRVKKERYDASGRQRTVMTTAARDDWVLLQDRHEGYITWERFEQIQKMIEGNRQRRHQSAPGAAKKGRAILTGLVRCARCGYKLNINYSGSRGDVSRYQCSAGQDGTRNCVSFSSIDVDARISAEVLGVVQPAAVEAACLAAEHERHSHDEVLRALRAELEAARYECDRVQRQYDAVDPANRLVADELERRWQKALEQVRHLEQRVDEAAGLQRTTELDTSEFQSLATDLSSVWNDPATDVRLKKRIVRTLIEEIVVDVDQRTNEILLLVHWKGGVHSRLRVNKRRRGERRTQTPVAVVEAVRVLARVCDDDTIARWLSRAGLLTARGNPWTRALVASLRNRNRIPRYSRERQQAEGWLTKKEAAGLLGVNPTTLYRCVQRGEITALHPVPNGPWIFHESDVCRPEFRDKLEQRRNNNGRGRALPSSPQLKLEISST